MYKISILFLFAVSSKLAGQPPKVINDTLVYQCKFQYTWVKDTANRSNKLKDQMCLEIYANGHTTYFSILKQNGLKKQEEDIGRQISLDEIAKNVSSYNTNSESEIILTDYKTNSYKLLDKLASSSYHYTSPVETLNWQIESDTMTILGFICQKATCSYSGRNFIGWFARGISLPYGPYKFSGLPGLILKIYDTKNEFVFECNSLSTKSLLVGMPYYESYKSMKKIKRTDLYKMKKLFFENYPAFLMAEKGVTFTPNNPNGYQKGKSRNHNMIELNVK